MATDLSEISGADLQEGDVDGKPGRSVVRLMWRLVNAVFRDVEDGKSLSFDEKTLLEDVLKYGTLKDVAKHHHEDPAVISARFNKAMERLDKRVGDLLNSKRELDALRMEMETYDFEIEARDIRLREMEEKLDNAESQNKRLQEQLRESFEIIRQNSEGNRPRIKVRPVNNNQVLSSSNK